MSECLSLENKKVLKTVFPEHKNSLLTFGKRWKAVETFEFYWSHFATHHRTFALLWYLWDSRLINKHKRNNTFRVLRKPTNNVFFQSATKEVSEKILELVKRKKGKKHNSIARASIQGQACFSKQLHIIDDHDIHCLTRHKHNLGYL